MGREKKILRIGKLTIFVAGFFLLYCICTGIFFWFIPTAPPVRHAVLHAHARCMSVNWLYLQLRYPDLLLANLSKEQTEQHWNVTGFHEKRLPCPPPAAFFWRAHASKGIGRGQVLATEDEAWSQFLQIPLASSEAFPLITPLEFSQRCLTLPEGDESDAWTAWAHWLQQGWLHGWQKCRQNTGPAFHQVKPLAVYFPQFHQDKTNDKLWHPGWTDFTWLRTAEDIIVGQSVPRPVRGYYDLMDIDIRQWQAEIARQHGVYGFAIYHYWFAGKRVLNRVTDQMLLDDEPNIPFALIWANEDWNRRWDLNKNEEVLLRQTYDRSSWEAQCDYLMQFFLHRNYIRVNNKPIYFVTQFGHILSTSDGIGMLRFLQQCAVRNGLDGILFVQTFNLYNASNVATNESHIGTERQPGFTLSKGRVKLRDMQASELHRMVEADFVDRHDAWKQMTLIEKPKAHFFRGAYTGWDNTPRILGCAKFLNRSGKAISRPTIHVGGSMKFYFRMLCRQLENSRLDAASANTAQFLLLNAWNEWGEGNVLEPDTVNGDTYLHELSKALQTHRRNDEYKRRIALSGVPTILFISHQGGGGVERYMTELAVAMKGKANFLILHPDWEDHDFYVLSSYPEDDNSGYRKFYIVTEAAERQKLLNELQSLPIGRVHIHHLLHWNPVMQQLIFDELMLPMWITLHDFYFLYSTPFLGDGRTIIPQTTDEYLNLLRTYNGTSLSVLSKRREFLFRATRIFAPSQFVALTFQKAIPTLRHIIVAPPLEKLHFAPVKKPTIASGDPLHIVIVGELYEEKGRTVVLETAQCSPSVIKFTLVGWASPPIPTNSKLMQTGPYQDEKLSQLLESVEPHVIWVASIVTETYNYVLSALLRSGYPIVAGDYGAFPERLTGRPWTWLEPRKSPADWVHFFLEIRNALLLDSAAAIPAARSRSFNFENVSHRQWNQQGGPTAWDVLEMYLIAEDLALLSSSTAAQNRAET